MVGDGYCACGCGQKPTIAPRNVKTTGDIKGKPHRYVKGHHPRRPIQERLLEKVVVAENGCWEWHVKPSREYATIRYGKRNEHAHRVSYKLFVGPVADDQEVHHLCENPRCVNPEHLLAVTPAQHGRFSARARQTHCKRGHPFNQANTYMRPNGTRECRRCHADIERTRKRRLSLTS